MGYEFGMHDGFGAFGGMPWFALVFFAIVIGVIVFTIGRGLFQWTSNNASPVETQRARIVNMRTDVHRHEGSHTWYYATFEFDNGERLELGVRDREYGQLAIGDAGMLTYQGTRYKGFERTMN